MRRAITGLVLSFLVSWLLACCLPSQGSAAEEEKNPALKYHAALKRRPEPGYLFDRFYNTWLDQSTAESLQEFLQKQASTADNAANHLLLAFFFSKQNNDVAAIDELAKAIKRGPASTAACYYRAQAEGARSTSTPPLPT